MGVARDVDEFDTLERSAVELGGGGAAGLCLMVSADGRFKTYPLPERGELTLGRGSRSDIRIEHPSVSRRHALLRLGARIEVEDLHSANGVRIQDRPLPAGGRSVVHVGEAMEVGEVMLVIRRANQAVRPRRLWPHGYFEGRVEEQCAR